MEIRGKSCKVAQKSCKVVESRAKSWEIAFLQGNIPLEWGFTAQEAFAGFARPALLSEACLGRPHNNSGYHQQPGYPREACPLALRLMRCLGCCLHAALEPFLIESGHRPRG